MSLTDNISVTSRTERSVFSTVTFDGMMYVAERMLETGISIILEGNFVPAPPPTQNRACAFHAHGSS